MPAINLKKINTQQKIIIYLLSIFIFAIIIIYFIIIPAINHIKDTRANIIGLKLEIEERYNKSKSLKRMKEKNEKIEPQIKILSSIFIDQNRELEFITTLEGVAGNNNVSQTINLSDAKDTSSQTYKKVPLELAVAGNFKNIMNYLINLETLPYYINIKTINLSSGSSLKSIKSLEQSQAPDNLSSVSINISADTFWLK